MYTNTQVHLFTSRQVHKDTYMAKMHARMSWYKLIELANEIKGEERFRLNYVIYELDMYKSQYLVLFNTSQITKKQFIDYVLDND